MMRTMLVSNLAVQERFANGTQGRLMFWHPTECTKGKSLYSSNPELLARFVKDSALNKREMLPGSCVSLSGLHECNISIRFDTKHCL